MSIDEELRKARDDAKSAAALIVAWAARSAAWTAAESAASAWSAAISVAWSAESAVCVEDIEGELDKQIDLILEQL